ncbi:KpsF/GutQ family sugar-phosphate isomerase [Novipirellula artificiosorum]|uniref:Arabinose 5-phosphate isomerase KpsF n=1 Tax=Novipirellula artificiosorum TaxID=2528016 RepID=A0A5C6DKQ4_9BACT|nr:KpsF/GutQ family sugar-phosphate isomerase [Novipirellula artificiosorum]TWU37172.1 Arabinose 5-phosphate isomerase KpsF [Novipirellula artificiosorum]
MSAAEKIPFSPQSPANSAANLPPATLLERLRILREIIAIEGNAILSAASQVTSDAVQAAEMTANCDGCVVVTGVGKAGIVGKKLVATLASTGTPAHFLHPAEAIHGDLGRVRQNDLVWAISNSGRSEEVVRIAPHLRQNSAGLIAITATDDNPLAHAADCVVAIGKHNEACPNGLAPTSSTAVMMAVGDGIAMLASRLRSFTPEDFARFHPGGALGQQLASVDQMMRGLTACRIAPSNITVREAMVRTSKNGRRTGAVMLVNDSAELVGIFTDSDLARLLETRNDVALDQPIADRMTRDPKTARTGTLLQEAIAVMSRRHISELPVVDALNRPLGMIDITDVAALLGEQDEPSILPIH